MPIFGRQFRSHPRSAGEAGFLAFIDSITEKLKSSGFASDADRLHELIHKMAWTTSSELLGELGMALTNIRKNRHDLPSGIATDIRYAIKAINRTQRWR